MGEGDIPNCFVGARQLVRQDGGSGDPFYGAQPLQPTQTRAPTGERLQNFHKFADRRPSRSGDGGMSALRWLKKRKNGPERSPSNVECGIEFLFIPNSAFRIRSKVGKACRVRSTGLDPQAV